MIQHCKASRFTAFNQSIQTKGFIVLSAMSVLLMTSPAMAHHPMDGKTPSNFWEGFLSGLAHPLIGVDHFAFIVTIGLLAAVKRQGAAILIAFMGSAMGGTGIHLLGFNFPGIELLISGTILLFGFLLTQKNDLKAITVLSTIAGVCHGYAYGEAIVGAQMTAVFAYLLGFTGIQLGIAAIAFRLGKVLLARSGQPQFFDSLRSTGFVVCGIGISLLFSQIVDVSVSFLKG
ncbi:HupE/UreJ family protein [Leptolyngbya sp. FACHB-17]|nr:HupE/UreJ family protein [Leptolyngbya sp. FACHB-17]